MFIPDDSHLKFWKGHIDRYWNPSGDLKMQNEENVGTHNEK